MTAGFFTALHTRSPKSECQDNLRSESCSIVVLSYSKSDTRSYNYPHSRLGRCNLWCMLTMSESCSIDMYVMCMLHSLCRIAICQRTSASLQVVGCRTISYTRDNSFSPSEYLALVSPCCSERLVMVSLWCFSPIPKSSSASSPYPPLPYSSSFSTPPCSPHHDSVPSSIRPRNAPDSTSPSSASASASSALTAS